MAIPKVLNATNEVLAGRLSKYATIVSNLDATLEIGYYTYIDTANNLKYLVEVISCAENAHIIQEATRINTADSTYSIVSRMTSNGGTSWTEWREGISAADIQSILADYTNSTIMPDVESYVEENAAPLVSLISVSGTTPTINIPEGESEYVCSSNISKLTVTYPSGHYETWIKFRTSTASFSLSLPSGTTYIGGAPSSWKSSKYYELSIKEGVAILAEVG